MKELAEKIQICINTLAVLNMPSIYDNVSHLCSLLLAPDSAADISPYPA